MELVLRTIAGDTQTHSRQHVVALLISTYYHNKTIDLDSRSRQQAV